VRATQARVVVAPELSPTGYELDAAPVACDHDVLMPIIDACAATDSLALVGAPIEEQGRRFIAMLAVDGAGARNPRPRLLRWRRMNGISHLSYACAGVGLPVPACHSRSICRISEG